MDYTHQK
ncbi:Protein of unknown function [Bacillus mycoides]|nr:Protein of unknown function [Bacillus mycoides]SCC62251.1 Protein of unknown function [Bacillus mycoides]SCM89902.1 Protein of unknown function [Bacillus mycoides]